MRERAVFEPEHEIFRNSVRRFLQDEVRPHAERWRNQGIVDRSAFRKAGEHGLLLMWAEPELGGSGIRDFRFEQIVIEEQARLGEVGFFMTLHSRLVAPYIGVLGTAEQKRRLLPRCASGEHILGIAMTEAGAGSDLAGMSTRAEEHGDHFLLNGSKTFISNGINGDIFVVAARTGSDRHAIGLFVVERGLKGFERGQKLRKLGLHAQDTAELFFNDVRVPRENVLGDPGKGFSYLMRFLAEERLIGACGSLANAQAAFDLTLPFVRDRRLFGRALGAFQNTRFKMAEMRTRLDVAQAFIDHCVRLHNADRLESGLAAEAKLHASEVEGLVVDECLQLHGGAGYMDEYPISRMYANARASRIYAGASEVMKEIIARGMGLDERGLP